jgi:3-dehydroquinate dehydratase/shikimate dehydrogenase
MNSFLLTTERLGLRKFIPADLEPFAALNADPRVMEFFPQALSRAEAGNLMQRINTKQDEQGFCFWAAELLATGELIGFVGLTKVSYETTFTPAVEIGWRLAYDFWGQGLATEGAKACLQFAFEKEGLKEVVSFTALPNQRSYRVMERIGMKRMGEFDHPKVPKGHVLERHVWYRLTKSEYMNNKQGSEK